MDTDQLPDESSLANLPTWQASDYLLDCAAVIAYLEAAAEDAHESQHPTDRVYLLRVIEDAAAALRRLTP